MRVFWIAALAVLVAGGTWWFMDRPGTGISAEGDQARAAVTMPVTLSAEARAGQQAFAKKCASSRGADAEGKAGDAPPLIHKIYEPGHQSTFSVEMPPVASPLGSYFINFEEMARAAEERSTHECTPLRGMIEAAAPSGASVQVTSCPKRMGGAANAAIEARYFDLAVVPRSEKTHLGQDMAQAIVFGSGRPVILVPSSAPAAPLDHVAIAWDESHVAARALGDTLGLLPAGSKVSVLTVQDEKALAGSGLSGRLAMSLERHGYDARAIDLVRGGRSVAATLQDATLAEGAQLLAMGGFGHSRLRDFVLGGATKEMLDHLRIATLMAH